MFICELGVLSVGTSQFSARAILSSDHSFTLSSVCRGECISHWRSYGDYRIWRLRWKILWLLFTRNWPLDWQPRHAIRGMVCRGKGANIVAALLPSHISALLFYVCCMLNIAYMRKTHSFLPLAAPKGRHWEEEIENKELSDAVALGITVALTIIVLNFIIPYSDKSFNILSLLSCGHVHMHSRTISSV